MKLFLSNTSHQKRLISLNIPEIERIVDVLIEPGAQISLLDGTYDFNHEQIEAIIRQIIPYNCAEWNDKVTPDNFVGLLWRTDKPITSDTMLKFDEANKQNLVKQGEKNREKIATEIAEAVIVTEELKGDLKGRTKGVSTVIKQESVNGERVNGKTDSIEVVINP